MAVEEVGEHPLVCNVDVQNCQLAPWSGYEADARGVGKALGDGFRRLEPEALIIADRGNLIDLAIRLLNEVDGESRNAFLGILRLPAAEGAIARGARGGARHGSCPRGRQRARERRISLRRGRRTEAIAPFVEVFAAVANGPAEPRKVSTVLERDHHSASLARRAMSS
jgi:hypothetical protein